MSSPENPDNSAGQCDDCRYVYVVATGGFRYPVESEVPLSVRSAFKAVLPRFERAGHSLGQLVEITECSDDGDSSAPLYIATESVLKKLGKLQHEDSDDSY